MGLFPTKSRQFETLTSVSEVHRWVVESAKELLGRLAPETVKAESSVGRVLSRSVIAEVDLPPFRRAMMDGIAIRQAKSNHYDFKVIKDSDRVPTESDENLAVVVQTGSPLQGNWDTVVPIEELELLQESQNTTLTIGDQVRWNPDKRFEIGANIAQVGEDVARGSVVIPAGRKIRIQDVAILAAIGISEVQVQRLPGVAVFATGDELASQQEAGSPSSLHYRINDANSPVLRLLVDRDGGKIQQQEVLVDDSNKIEAKLLASQSDVLIISGGTSVGPKDFIASIVHNNGQLKFHGLNMRPGKPMGIGTLGNKVAFLLPGNPVACQFGYEILVRPFLQIASGGRDHWPYQKVAGKLKKDIVSKVGRLDYMRVRFEGEEIVPMTSGRASNLSTLADADGFVLVPEEVAEIPTGNEVTAYLFD